jgi:hypothetical protein
MHAFDAQDERQMNNFIQQERDFEIYSLIEQLNEWQMPNDDAHTQHLDQLNNSAIVRSNIIF